MIEALKQLVRRSAYVRVDRGRFGQYYSSPSARDEARRAAMREVDLAMYMLSARR